MSQINTMWKINNQEFELDMQDAETAEKYELAFKKMAENEKSLPKDGVSSTYIRAYHDVFIKLYDDLFGKGAGIKILGEKANSRICNETYADFLEFIADQKNAQLDFNNNLTTRYSANRAQRRAMK